MMPMALAWSTSLGELRIFDAVREDLEPYAERLAAAYNEPETSRLLGLDPVSVEDVLAWPAELSRGRGGFYYLLHRDDQMIGCAELAIEHHDSGYVTSFTMLIPSPTDRRQGLGTAFATMVHVDAFRYANLDRVTCGLRRENVAGLKLLGKLGYVEDRARATAEYRILAVEQKRFLRREAPAVTAIRRALR